MITNFFAAMYGWFGLIHLYSADMAEYLHGLDRACTGYYALPWFQYVGLAATGVTLLIYLLQFHVAETWRFDKRQHWLLSALAVAIANFFIAFGPAYYPFGWGYCPNLTLTFADCLGFALSNVIWSLILFSTVTIIFGRLNRSSGK